MLITPHFREKLTYFAEISKLRIASLVVTTTALGYCMGLHHQAWRNPLYPGFQIDIFFVCLLGTLLTCCGSAALNCYLERDFDRMMPRTAKRVLPSGKLPPHEALSYGILSVLTGVALLSWYINLLTGFLALLTAFLYVLVYTPLKRVTWLNTLIGAIPGALPPVGGYAAATGDIGGGAVFLFAIMFLWQHPHFYAIAWMYKDDYAQAGYKMLPNCDTPDGKRTFWQICFFSALLLPASLLPVFLGHGSLLYASAALGLGLWLLGKSISARASRTRADARSLMFASLIYLPALLSSAVLDMII